VPVALVLLDKTEGELAETGVFTAKTLPMGSVIVELVLLDKITAVRIVDSDIELLMSVAIFELVIAGRVVLHDVLVLLVGGSLVLVDADVLVGAFAMLVLGAVAVNVVVSVVVLSDVSLELAKIVLGMVSKSVVLADVLEEDSMVEDDVECSLVVDSSVVESLGVFIAVVKDEALEATKVCVIDGSGARISDVLVVEADDESLVDAGDIVFNDSVVV